MRWRAGRRSQHRRLGNKRMGGARCEVATVITAREALAVSACAGR
jgi:ribosomal protein L27